MTEEQTHSVLLVVLGATAVWLWWSGQVLNYVRPGLAPWLLAGGVIVGLLGLLPPLGLLANQGTQTHAGEPDGHHRTRVGWLLLVPTAPRSRLACERCSNKPRSATTRSMSKRQSA
jgi:putative membrane protein